MLPRPLTDRLDESTFGGKAAQLSTALRAGLPVPDGVALPVVFVDAVAAGLPHALAKVTKIFKRLGGPLAVRSSAVGEDSEIASFAGQHETHLNITSVSALIEAVRATWQSARSESVLTYRKRMGLVPEPKMGIILQTLVSALTAGVLFTRNPFDGADEVVIEASWGLGEAVVASLVTPDRYRLSRDGTVIERVPGIKPITVQLLAHGGVEQRKVVPELVHARCLDDAQLRRLHTLATRCEEVFGGIQDLEWAFTDSTLYLLQRRAATVLQTKASV
jgi:pyruvate,water dikinase